MCISRFTKLSSCASFLSLFSLLFATDPQNSQIAPDHKIEHQLPPSKAHFEAFTGKITKNRVRLRLQPDLASNILKEFSKDDLVVVTGQTDDFYAVLPTHETKGYVFRTYILDGQVEGSHVNVRLEPDTQAPVLFQLNSGEKVEGKVCAHNNKWLEIALPDSVRFYVAKEFVTKIGTSQTFYELETQKKHTEEKLAQLEHILQEEFKKPFQDIHLNTIATELNQIIAKNKEFPQQVEKAQTLLKNMQETYLKKSISAKSASSVAVKEAKKTKQADEIAEKPETQPAPLSIKQEELHENKELTPSLASEILPWKELEKKLVQDALVNGSATSLNDFYAQEEKKATPLKGILKPYLRHIKNLPGDFVLLDATTKLPLAYIYSTKVDLTKFVDKETTLFVVERPNNNFAYPAFFALRCE
jgi:hypothetical protein